MNPIFRFVRVPSLVIVTILTCLPLSAHSEACPSSLKVREVNLPDRLDLSQQLKISVTVEEDSSLPFLLKGQEAFLYGKTTSKAGFYRTVEKIAFSRDPKRADTYQATIDLPRFITETNLWPAIRKAQTDLQVKEIEVMFQSRLVDSQGCLSAPLSAVTLVNIGGFDRNNAIPGHPSVITDLEGPSSITFGKPFVVRGTVKDPDNDIKDSPKMSGYLSVDWLPTQFPLPPGLRARRISPNVFEAVISTTSFGFYERFLRLLPDKAVRVRATITVEDIAGHLSDPAEIQFTVHQNKGLKNREVSHASY